MVFIYSKDYKRETADIALKQEEIRHVNIL
jgi:hypothetical protein